jgi:cytoskeletal protein RodZ
MGVINKDVYIKLAGIEQQKIVHITAEVVAPEQPKQDATDAVVAAVPVSDKPVAVKETATLTAAQMPAKDAIVAPSAKTKSKTTATKTKTKSKQLPLAPAHS